MNIVIHTTFISEHFPLLIEYVPVDDTVDIISVRIIRQVVNGSEIYARANGARMLGPVYEAVWLHGQAGVDNILSGAQLVEITELVEKELKNAGQVSINEESIVYLEGIKWKP